MTSAKIYTTVNDLMNSLSESINGILPTLIKVKLVDHQLEGYDGWDSISESLLAAVDVGSTAMVSVAAGLVTDLGLNIIFNSPPPDSNINDIQNINKKPNCP